MKVTRISRGGQVQVPAEVRRRWRTETVVIEDLGGEISIRPVPDDPIGMALRPLASRYTSDELRRMAREDDEAAEERKWGDSSRRVGTRWRNDEGASSS